MSADTIAALATPPGLSAIAIVRVSGPRARAVFRAVFAPAGPRVRPRTLHYGHLMDGGERVDEIMAVYMRAPRTYTGEDIAEFHCHGGRESAQRALRLCLKKGARIAQPGEFTRRAFECGRVDLAQAEAVMDMICATGEAGSRAALRQMEGGLSRFVARVYDEIAALLADIEAATDFPEEIDSLPVAGRVAERAAALARELRGQTDPNAGRVLREGAFVALCGKPNVGKSALLNALLGGDYAIVTPIAGTTRDAQHVRFVKDGYAATFIDTAGQGEAADEAERLGMDRAVRAMRDCDVALLVLDGARPLDDYDRALWARMRELGICERALAVLNKTDLPQALSRDALRRALDIGDERILDVSAQSGAGIEPLLSEVFARVADVGATDAMLVSERHAQSALCAADSLEQAARACRENLPLDLVAIDLMDAGRALGEITGASITERAVDEIFARFCVGK